MTSDHPDPAATVDPAEHVDPVGAVGAVGAVDLEETPADPEGTPADPPHAGDPARHPGIAAVVRDVKALLVDRHRVVVGLAGPPGAGKTAVAEALVARLRVLGTPGVVVPMDGFRLDRQELVRLGRADRPGAPDTFDVGGYVALLRRLRDADEVVVHAPRFDPGLQLAVGSALPVMRAVRVVVTVGDYLLLQRSDLGRPVSDAITMPLWGRVRDQLDACWFVDADPADRTRRLVERQVARGHALEVALDRVARLDEASTGTVEATRSRADRVVTWDPAPR